MYRKQVEKRYLVLLALVLAIAGGSVLLARSMRRQVKRPLYDTAVEAAEQLQKCMDAVKAEKAVRGIALAEEDTFETGMLGEEYNFITTTVGDLEAKRTTADPDMAALMVFMLDEAGLSEGDMLGCCFSGSFPALNLAVLCACDAMGITPVYVCSCGASTWGANNPELSFPEMAVLLYEQGLISSAPALITPGGGDDVGEVADPEEFAEIWGRACALGCPVLEEADLEKNVLCKKDLLDSAGIDCFLAAGGNISATGTNMVVDLLGQGILTEQVGVINSGSGLIERYLHEGTPVILLLNIRQLCTDYGMRFDPPDRMETGTGSVYFETAYPAAVLWAGAAGTAAVCAAVFRKEISAFFRKRRSKCGNAA